MSVRIIDKAAEKVVGVRVVGPYPQTIPQGSQQLLAASAPRRAVRQMAGVVLGRSGGSGAGKAARRRGDERGG